MNIHRPLKLVAILFLIAIALFTSEVKRRDAASAADLASLQEVFCGTEIGATTSSELAKTESKRREYLKDARSRDFVIPVHFHVIHNGSLGMVEDQTLIDQIEVLNDSFRRQGFTFVIGSIERIDSRSWFGNCDATGVAARMKSELRIGSVGDLNVYSCSPTRFLGLSAFPWNYATDPSNDGIVLHYGVLPGGIYTDFNTGEVLTHETGHWLGLFHTFQNGCNEPGDDVADTPAEAVASFNACPIGLDTCPAEGLDPTDNYMDYSGDACWTRFSDGQSDRMTSMFAVYRDAQ